MLGREESGREVGRREVGRTAVGRRGVMSIEVISNKKENSGKWKNLSRRTSY